MVTLNNAETLIQSDRVPLYMGANRFYLKQGVQSSSRDVTIPSETIDEQGNNKHRGIVIQSAEYTTSIEQLSVDMDMEQILSFDYATIGASMSGDLSLKGATNGIAIFPVGPSDHISHVVCSFYSGTVSGLFSCGAGSVISAVSSSGILSLKNTGDGRSFAAGNTVSLQISNATYNSSTATVTKVSGDIVTITGFDATSYAVSGYIWVYDNYPVNSIKWIASGVPNTSVKGLEFFNYKDATTTVPAVTGSAVCGIIALTPAGTVTPIDSDDYRGNLVDAIMLINNYSNELMKTRYIQDLGVTGVTYNYSGDGNATESYEFTASKSLEYTGYVLRKSMIVNAAIGAGGTLNIVADNDSIFTGSEAPVIIETSTSLNEHTWNQYFLKVTAITAAGARTTLTEVASTATPTTAQYKYDGTNTVTFGGAVASGTRLEFTYLCQAANVASSSEYHFDATAFSHYGTPDVIAGGYQPLTINTTDFDDRIQGLESSTMSIAFSRDLYKTQGRITAQPKPASIGEVTGTLTAKEGSLNLNRVLMSGTNDLLVANTQNDINKIAKYTSKNTIPLRVRLLDPLDNTTEIKTCKLSNIQITGESNGNSTGSDSTLSYNFSCRDGNILISR